MFRSRWIPSLCTGGIVWFCLTLPGSAIELTTNGDFETGDFSGWTQFPTNEGQQTVTNVNPSSGVFAGKIFNDIETSNSLIKQANLAAGALTAGQSVQIAFDARGMFGIGGVSFAEVFSEIDGGGVSKTEILSGGPLAVASDPNVWTRFVFTTTLGPNVSGGVTLQLGAVNGAVANATTTVWFDNVSVSVDSLTTTDPSADFDGDLDVDGADFLIWQRGYGLTNQTSNARGDADFSGAVEGADLAIWETQIGSGPLQTAQVLSVPEPTGMILLLAAAICGMRARNLVG
jgi:hypothetical protein